MKKILTLAFLLILLKAGAQTSINAVTCGQHNLYLRVTFTDSIVPLHDVSTTTCADNSVHTDTEEGEFLKCKMELFLDAACTQPVSVDPRFFAFARDIQGSAGTRDNPSIIYGNNCSATIPGGSAHDYNFRIDYSMIYIQQCIWECSGSGYYNCYSTQPGTPLNYNIIINCCYAPALLAVHLVNFNGQRISGINLLSWNLENKQDFVRLDLERSFDGINYTVVFSSVDANIFQYADQSDNTAYYRLKISSSNNMVAISPIILLKSLSFIDQGFIISPSPFHNVLNISVTAIGKQRSIFKLVSMEGKIVFQAEREISIGRNNFIFYIPTVSPGIYIITMSNDKGMVARKILKQ